VLYAFYHSDNCDKAIAENELRHSLQKAYDLYFYLLALMVELTRFAEQKIDAARNKYLPTDKEKNPQMRFVENLFVKQLSENEQLNEYLKKRKLSWVNYQDALKRMYQEITESDFFADYMSVDEHSYDADKNLWKKIFKMEMSDGSPLLATLEDENAYWLSDVDIIGSFVFKTIKMFKQENASAQELLPMYKDPADLAFALKLFHTTIDCYEEFGKMIDEHVKNWEIDRIAFMDTLIMKTAIAELLSFPTIPTNVTLNEYIEIAKMFSTPRSSLFINGVLDQIAAYLKADNQLEKLVDFTRDTK